MNLNTKNTHVTIVASNKETPKKYYELFRPKMRSDAEFFEHRTKVQPQTVDVTFHVSKRDLDSFDSQRPAAGESQNASAAIVFPFANFFAGRTEDPSIVLIADMQILASDFCIDPEDCLYAGSSLAMDFLALQARVLGDEARSVPAVSDYVYYNQLDPNRLLYQLRSKDPHDPARIAAAAPSPSSDPPPARKVIVERIMAANLPKLDLDPDIRAVAQRAFMPQEAYERGTQLHNVRFADGTLRSYRIVPEIHGIAQIIKEEKEMLASNAYIFCTELNGAVYLRVPEEAFQKAVACAKEDPIGLRSPNHLAQSYVYLTRKQPGEYGFDPEKARNAPPDADYDFKRRVVLRLQLLCIKARFAPSDDVFLSAPDSISYFRPGLNHLDPLLSEWFAHHVPSKTEPDKWDTQLDLRMPSVRPREIAEHLQKERQRRAAVKKGTPPTDLRQDISYSDLLQHHLLSAAAPPSEPAKVVQ
jgi:hypothetical protein